MHLTVMVTYLISLLAYTLHKNPMATYEPFFVELPFTL